MNRLPRQSPERLAAQLARQGQPGAGLKKDAQGRATLNVSGGILRVLPDGSCDIDLAKLAEALLKESVTIRLDDGKIDLAPESVEAPLTWNPITSAHGLGIKDNLEVDNEQLRVVRAIDPGNCPSGSLGAIAAHVDLLRDAFITAGTMV